MGLIDDVLACAGRTPEYKNIDMEVFGEGTTATLSGLVCAVSWVIVDAGVRSI